MGNLCRLLGWTNRPFIYNNLNFFEWIQCAEKKKRTLKERSEFEEDLKMAQYLQADYHRAALERLQDDNLDEVEDHLEDEVDDDADYAEEPELEDKTYEHQDDISD
jgi:hypothetical protein